MRSKGASRGVSRNLAAEPNQTKKLAKSSIKSIDPLTKWQKEEEFEMKLEHEITENELNGFTFRCIEALANFSKSGQSMQVMLTELVREKLISFMNLAEESQQAKVEFREYVAWSKQFIATVQPLLSASAGPAQEVSQLTNQVMHCAERSMGQKYRVSALRSRVDFLVESVANYVASTGAEMGLPKPTMDKVAVAVRRALIEAAK